MFAFLAVVAESDFEKGIMVPSYTLCKTIPKSGYTAGYRIVAANCKFRNQTKVLVTTLTGHEDLIEYMSSFRAVHYYKKDARKRFFVRGALCWFPCNRYGERIANQPPIFIMKVPAPGRYEPEKGKERMEAVRSKKKRLATFLTDEPFLMAPDTFNVKRKMPESAYGRRSANGKDDGEQDRIEWGEVGF